MFLFQTCGQLEHCLKHIDRVENVTVVCLCKCRLQACFFYEEKLIFMKNYCFIHTKIEMFLVKSWVFYRQMYLKCYEQTGSFGSIIGENDRYVSKTKK